MTIVQDYGKISSNKQISPYYIETFSSLLEESLWIGWISVT